jgi:uncharacterized repeat protein (TIGR01451 family)
MPRQNPPGNKARSHQKRSRDFIRRLLVILLAVGLALPASATNHILRQDQLMAGFNGDPTVQFLVITVGGNDQKAWGPQGGETSSRAMLVFFNSNGVQTGTFFFPNNPPQGGLSVLIATTNFANLPGAPVPDIIIPPLINPGSGKVSFRGNPANPFRFDVTLSLSYGNFPAGLTDGAGVPAPALPINGDATSLTRVQDFGFGNGTSRNADFALLSAVPINTRGQTFTFPVDGPEIDVSPKAINFGGQNLVAGPTAARNITITSRGTVNPLVLSNIFLSGAQSNQFIITAGGGGPVTLATGSTHTVTLTFDPSTVGAKTAALRITSDDTNEPISDVALAGLGIDPNAPDIDVASTNVNFGVRDIAQGAGSSIGVLIRNTGSIGTLVLSNLSFAGPNTNDFRIVSDTGQSSLGPGASRAISFIFAPASPGGKSAALRVVSNDPDEGLQQINLDGFTFDLNPCTAPNPTNSVAQDSCMNAMLVCPGPVFSGFLPATAADGQSSCLSAGGDLWFRYVPAGSGMLTVNLQGIGMVPVISAHSSCPGTTANQLACQSAAGSNSSIAQISLSVAAGTPILLRVAAAAAVGTNGQFQLALAGPPCFDFDKNRNGTTDICESDFGSAPSPFPTTVDANGARHLAFTGVFLGARVDPNDDGLPSTGATGDKLDGPENDEDGVLFTSPLTVGNSTTLEVTASTNGFLNAWVDFNADGEWRDANEQVFTNRMLSAGLNTLSFSVPTNSVVTNRTYARFRFNSAGNLAPTGPASDGEVEDYALEILPVNVAPGALQVRINEVMAGLNGDSTVQFVELEVNGDADKAWGPQNGETAGRAMLAFFDETGNQSGRFVFPSNAPGGGNFVLVATRAFAEQTGLRPDFIMPPEVVAIAGKVAFMANPDNAHFAMNIALSYGGRRYFGLTDGAGSANSNEVSILGARSLGRAGSMPFGVNQNGAFLVGNSTPRNTADQAATLIEAPLVDQGRALFTRETFRGNGRTCATCHIAGGRDQFGLTPLSILDLSEDDPLFVFEKNVNALKLVQRSHPSDLRGPITGSIGNGQVLAGSGDTYFILAGTSLAGLVSDTNGNVGIFQTLTRGNLEGQTPGNGSPRGLEDHGLLEHGRGLILENIDGFRRREVFRASPHLLNISQTAPFGLSGEFGNLEDFSDGAVAQHFPRTLARISGVDFRHPTRAELLAMTAFMNGIVHPRNQNFELDRFATTEAQKRGRTMFFNNEGKCFKCHSGPVLNLSDGSLLGSRTNVNENFNTGVANLLRNLADGLPTEPAGLPDGQSERAFNVPPLMGVRLTAPFFHDGVVTSLKEAVEFYDTEEFLQSPAGQGTGTILAANRPDKVSDLVAFLESLVELPIEFTRDISFGIHCPGAPAPGPMTALITNISGTTISITNVTLVGTNATEFTIISDTGPTNLAPGQVRSITVGFNPAAPGAKRATLQLTGVDTNLLGRFDFGVALFGADVDNVVTAAPAGVDFGTRDIDAPPSAELSILITNNGSTALDLSGFVVTGPTPEDFVVTADTSPIAPHDVRIVEVSFAPRTRGPKLASLRIPVVACNTTLLDIALTGTASSAIHHFAWDALAATQYVGAPVPVRITAQDRNNGTVDNFSGTVKLMSATSGQTNSILISPTNSSVFVSGVWSGTVTVQQPAPAMRLLARDNQGHTGLSDPFLAPLGNDLTLTATDSPDPIVGGQRLTYTLTIHNTGPQDATGVVLTDTLSSGVTFASGSVSQGTFSHAGGIVTCALGTLGRGATAAVTLNVDPIPPTNMTILTNVAILTRSEPETVLTNNVAVNTTTIGAFGVLSVTPSSNFNSSGFVGGPFTPTNQVYVLSNSGTAVLSWQARSSGCTPVDGVAVWLPLDGNAADVIGTNNGVILGSPSFTNGFVGTAMIFDGIDDEIDLPASPRLNLGTNDGFSIEAWIKPADVSSEHPLVEWNNRQGVLGAVLILSVPASGNGSLFASLNDTAGGGHVFSSSSGIVMPNVWQHVGLTYNKMSGTARLYLNGVVVAQANFGVLSVQTSFDVFLGRRFAVSGSTFRYAGLMDEVTFYNRELSTSEFKNVFDSGATGKCANQTVPSGNCSTPGGLTAWFPLDGTTLNRVGTNVGILIGGAAFTNGFVGQAVALDGNDDFVRLPAGPEINVGVSGGMTVETWINITDINRNDPIFEWSDGSSAVGPHLWISQAGSVGSIFINFIDINNVSHSIQSGGNVLIGNAWQHVAFTYNRANGILVIYVNGVPIQQQNVGTITPKTQTDLLLGRRQAAGSNRSFLGLIDEPSLYNRDLTAAEIQAIFLSGSRGKCSDQSWFGFAPVSGTLNPGMSTNVNVVINTNAHRLTIGSYSDMLSFTNTSTPRGSTNRVVSLAVLNRPPTLGALSAVQIAEDSGPRVVAFTGISSGGNMETQVLTVTATSSNPGLVANPIPVNYISPSANGTLTLLPLTNAFGTAIVSVVVRDNGGAANGATDAVTNSFVLVVTPVNDAPSLVAIADMTIPEQALFILTNVVSDPDLPGDQLTFSILSAPTGMVIDAVSGVLAWTPSEQQGPGTNSVAVLVRDSGLLSATNRFTLTVLDVNAPPVLHALPDRAVLPGELVSIDALATDADLPANVLTYSLGSGAPVGAAINPTNGLFVWTASDAPIPNTNLVTLIVTDNGNPPMSDNRAFRITVIHRPLIESVAVSGTNLLVRWASDPGVRYGLQFKDVLADPQWTDITDTVVATDLITSQSVPVGQGRRFYQVRVVP